MSNFVRFFNYNWFSLFKNNFRNNKYSKVDTRDVCGLVFRREICSIVFVVLQFLITYVSSIDLYKMNYESFIFFRVFKDNLLVTLIWLVLLSILPIVSVCFFKGHFKNKFYLLLDLFYLFSNVFHIFLTVYFITCFINCFWLSIIGIINIVITIIINCCIIIKINEGYLIH